jgi:hypothetical protein
MSTSRYENHQKEKIAVVISRIRQNAIVQIP